MFFDGKNHSKSGGILPQNMGGGEFKPTLSLVSNGPGISIFYSSSTDAMHASTLMEKSGCNSLAAWFKVFLIKN